ncbi:hypothetical protein POV27_02440 [Aureisphaera galaxeae]|uniref:GldL-related protein n=1 Tax=Aureisphaera galaxeae TaxID=1538023 RepID=UPI002350613E|nr:hypothetical protein [Aureisphaera galaxeae]MDC8002901.1 hypothetical protein [Aureisphaera galaxeae]
MSRLRIQQPWRIAAAIALIGILFKLLHLTYAPELLIIGLAGILILYPIHFLKKRKKGFLDYAKLFFAIFGTLHYGFRIFHLDYGYVFTRLMQLSLLLLIIAYVSEKYVGGTSSKTEIWETLLYVIAGVGIVIGATLKILHWPYGNFLLIGGLVAAAISVVIGSFTPKE